jgi:hypothetical protein
MLNAMPEERSACVHAAPSASYVSKLRGIALSIDGKGVPSQETKNSVRSISKALLLRRRLTSSYPWDVSVKVDSITTFSIRPADSSRFGTMPRVCCQFPL